MFPTIEPWEIGLIAGVLMCLGMASCEVAHYVGHKIAERVHVSVTFPAAPSSAAPDAGRKDR